MKMYNLIDELYKLALEIEKLPASEQQTKIAVMLADIKRAVAQMENSAEEGEEVCDCGKPFPDNGECGFCGAHRRYAKDW
jgi:hypothetical protein